MGSNPWYSDYSPAVAKSEPQLFEHGKPSASFLI
jgi:hypothetical protein